MQKRTAGPKADGARILRFQAGEASKTVLARRPHFNRNRVNARGPHLAGGRDYRLFLQRVAIGRRAHG